MKVDLDVIPWDIPTHIYLKLPPGKKADGFRPREGIPIEDVDAEFLSALCDEFREGVFKKVGKEDPKKIRQSDWERP